MTKAMSHSFGVVRNFVGQLMNLDVFAVRVQVANSASGVQKFPANSQGMPTDGGHIVTGIPLQASNTPNGFL